MYAEQKTRLVEARCSFQKLKEKAAARLDETQIFLILNMKAETAFCRGEISFFIANAFRRDENRKNETPKNVSKNDLCLPEISTSSRRGARF